MNSTLVYYLFLLFCVVKIVSQPVHADDERSEMSHHPFPEMNRFLNSHPHIHQSSSHTSTSLLEYLCSAIDDGEKVKEILNTFRRKARPLILAIIEQDCIDYHQRHKPRAIKTKRKNVLRIFPHGINNRQQQQQEQF